MIYKPEYVKSLLQKMVNETATAEEIEILLVALDIYTGEEIEGMMDEIEPSIDFSEYGRLTLGLEPLQELDERIFKVVSEGRRPAAGGFYQYVAMGLFFCGFVAIQWILLFSPGLLYSCNGLADDAEIPTGNYSCKIILANGYSLQIDSSYQGMVATEGNMDILRSASGEMVFRYNADDPKMHRGKDLFNLVSTAPGAQCRIALPDGSRIRLNASSSIRFPLDYSAGSGRVELNGEAFFEIPQGIDTPFLATVGNTRLKVTGTEFNINSYNGNLVTTVIKGSLEINHFGRSVLLQPGEQAIVFHRKRGRYTLDTLIKFGEADMKAVLSWGRTLHIYRRTDLKDFLIQIGRWYNLEIININAIPKGYLSGSYCYDTPLDELLDILRKKGIRLKKEGSRLLISS